VLSGDGKGVDDGDEAGMGLKQEKDTRRLHFEAGIEPLVKRQERKVLGGSNGTGAAGGRPLRVWFGGPSVLQCMARLEAAGGNGFLPLTYLQLEKIERPLKDRKWAVIKR